MRVQPIKRFETYDWLKYKHYLHRIPPFTFAFGLFDVTELTGVVTYGVPASPCLCRGICGHRYRYDVLELNRLCCIDDTLKNTESYFIGKTLRWLSNHTDYQVVVSYADPEYNHSGVIYKASNFIHYGMSGTDKVLIVDGKKYHRRFINKDTPAAYEIKQRYEDNDENVYFKPTVGKHIYIYYLDKKLKRKHAIL